MVRRIFTIGPVVGLPIDGYALAYYRVPMTAKAVQSVRDAIRTEMARRGITTYQLWKMVEGHMSKPTVYDFLSGEKSMTSDKLELLLNAMDLRIGRAK